MSSLFLCKMALVVGGLASLCGALPLWGAEPAKTEKPPTPGEMLAFFEDTKGTVLNEWTDLNSDSQAWSKHTKDGYAPVRNEGRVHSGADQYQKIFKKKLPGMSVWCRTAETEAAHRQNDVSLLKKGYILVRLQTFTDAGGTARFQGLWVKVAEPPTDAAG
ncbi:hypothetical protein [Verrucomicrobium sp. BvORR106]|uniref:hypothetical protein n=1 Tax=Verrucomicrobium sp. BvORR106 TaxID=1403819 RepID=UPI002240F267|nr:hypothetical protein [Verrucomicrobium sp. BvORR106]